MEGSPAHVYGWMCLVGNEGRTFTADDEDLVMALAGQVGRIYELEDENLERKQAESALRYERDRAQRYLDTADVILLALDTNGRMAFSRKQIIEPTQLDLNVVLVDLRGMLERLIGEDVTVVLRPGPQLAHVMADRGQIEQIVLNLAVNARDAMPSGGTLTIETANVDLDEHYAKLHIAVTPGPHVVLTMTDTGIGMSPQVQARLFEPFFTTKEPGKGTGLGLAMVHGIVAQSGGSVNVYSEVGRGTSFAVYFPRAGAAEKVIDTPPAVARPRTAAIETVLVVEDADGLRELTKGLLQRQGYTVLVAANAEEALQLFDGNPSIGVLLTDVVMPGASGSLRSLRALH